MRIGATDALTRKSSPLAVAVGSGCSVTGGSSCFCIKLLLSLLGLSLLGLKSSTGFVRARVCVCLCVCLPPCRLLTPATSLLLQSAAMNHSLLNCSAKKLDKLANTS